MQMLAVLAAIGLYLGSFILLFQQVKNNQLPADMRFKTMFFAAILGHASTLHFTAFADQALHLGFFNVSSLIFCVIAVISFIAYLRRLEIENLILLLLPLAAISIASYYCNDVFGKDVCNLFLKDENTFSLG